MNDEKYRLILENMISGIAVFEPDAAQDDFIITEFNKAACKIENVIPEHVIGKSLRSVFFHANKAGLRNAVKRVHLTGVSERYAEKRLCNEKISVWIDHFLYKISTGEVVSVFKDETDRKIIEQSLKESEQKLRAISHSSPLGICLVRNRSFDWVNDTLCKFTGYDSEALLGTSARLFYRDEQEYERIGKKLYSESNKTRLVTAMTQWVRKDGSVLNCSIRKSPVDKDDLSCGFIVAVADISERMQFEEDNKRLEELLLHSQKMEALGVLAGGIAHDFNNILFPIMGYTELMMMDAKDEATVGYLQGITSAVNRSTELIQQILSFSRKKTGKKEPMFLQPLVKEIIKLLKATFPSNIKIIHDIKYDCEPIMADSTQMHQVIMNLCINAYHAMEYKGGKLKFTVKQVEINTDQAKKFSIEPGQFIMLEISDTGTGIEPSIKNKIFDPYFTTKSNGKGTGIGLFAVHTIIKKFKGEIQVESEPGAGTVFRVYLPVALSHEKTETKDTSLTSLHLLQGKGNILLIDDEKEIILFLNDILTRQGYSVTCCGNSVEALSIFTEIPFKFDLIITDLNMPGMTGIELCEKINKIRFDIPILMCTGFCENDSMKNLKKKRIISETVKKPIIMNHFLKIIKKIIKNKE